MRDAHRPLEPGAIRLGGWLGQRLDDCVRHRIAAQDVAALVTPFRVRDETWTWRTEFWGKWFTSAASAWRLRADARAAREAGRRGGGPPWRRRPRRATSVPIARRRGSPVGMSGAASTSFWVSSRTTA
ncbi:MAG: hypothetical protein MZU95_14915 [Desulfomicrobium escambiense]|nr:hypothetical protein [Desulfomicrobium escambiense]